MKKTLSRLVCVLLVVAMFCGMVPAVMAAPPTAVPGDSTGDGTKEHPYIMYVGDYELHPLTKPEKCARNHTNFVLSYGTEGIWDDVAGTASGYISYDATNRKLTASKATISKLDGKQGVAYVQYKCNTKDCDQVGSDRIYAKVYSKATGIALKRNYDNKAVVGAKEDLTLLANMSGENAYKFQYRVLDDSSAWYNDNERYGTAYQNISVKSTDNSVFEVKDYDMATQSFSIETKNVDSYSAGSQANLVITADEGTTHEKIRVIEIFVAKTSTIEIKKGSTVMGRTDDLETRIHYGYIGDTMTLTATDASGYANTDLVDWISSDESVAEFTSKNGLTLKSAGQATITAKMGTCEAEFILRVIDKNISAIDIVKPDNVEIKGLILDAGESQKAKPALTPTSAEEKNSQFVVWTSSDYDVVNFEKVLSSDTFEQDIDTKAVTANQVNIRGLKAGTATVTAEINGKKDSFLVTVNEVKPTKYVVEVVDRSEYDVRASVTDSSVDILTRMAAKYKTVPAYYLKDKYKPDEKTMTTVPVEWTGTQGIDKVNRTVKVTGQLKDTDGAFNYTFKDNSARTLTVTVDLTDGVAVTSAEVKASTNKTTGGQTIQLSVVATVEPSDAELSYQWYQNDVAISGATKANVSWKVPADNSPDAREQYAFTCLVTAKKDGKSGTLESPTPAVVTVERDYAVTMSADDSAATYVVGETAKITGTMYHKGVAQNAGLTWTLYGSDGKSAVPTSVGGLTITGNTATITIKSVNATDGEKFIITATGTYNGVTVTGSQTITYKPASVESVKMTVGAGGALKTANMISAINTAVGTGVTASYVTFGTPTGVKLTTSAGGAALDATTKCYISTSGGQQLSNVHVTPNANSTGGSVSYTVYNASNGILATGTLNFDATQGGTTITSKGTNFQTAGLVDDLAPDGVGGSDYVTFGTVTGGTLYYNYTSFVNKEELDKGDRYYFTGTGGKLLANVYFLPEADVYTGTVECRINGSQSHTVTFKTNKQSSSTVFTDVTGSVGSWSSNAIDFMAANGLVGGTGGTRFSPSTQMTRGMLVTVLYRAAGKPSVAGMTIPFTDVPRTQYYYDAVVWAYNNGVVTGSTATKFNPNGNITRQDIAVILYRYADSPAVTGATKTFADSNQIANYAVNAINWAVAGGIIGGKGGNKLDPKGQATRAEVAVMLYRFLTK